MFAGLTGIYTAFKDGAFSLSENQRDLGEGVVGFLKNVLMIFTGYSEISWIVRDAFIQCDDFYCAESYLSSQPVIAPGYLIVAGLKGDEGVVISRDRFGVAHVDRLNDTRWYILQTN